MSTRVPILMYHKVAPVDPQSLTSGHYVHPASFRRQMRALKALRFESVSLNSLFEAPLPNRPVVITFDDGYQNFFDSALPAMEESGMKGTVFLVTNLLGKTNLWDTETGDVEEALMAEATILAAAKRGTEFGSHTANHVHLDQVDAAVAEREIAESRDALRDLIGVNPTSFCYPYGGKTSAIQSMVAAAGYRVACSTEKGSNDASTNRFALRRTNIRRDTALPVFVLKLLRDLRNGQ